MSNRISRFITAVTLVLVIDVLMLLAFNIPFEWYLLPVTICGIMCTYQIINIYHSTRLNKIRVPLVFYFYCTLWCSCYFAPMLHFALQFWLIFNNSLILPTNWEPYVLVIAIVNAIGLSLFIVAYRFFYAVNKPGRNVFLLIKGIKLKYVYALCLISFVVQLFIYAKLGGISGFISAYETRGEDQQFAGFGLFFIISEFFPTGLIFLFYVKSLRNPAWRSTTSVFVFMAVLFMACMFFGGLRGSRSNTVLTLLHAGMVIHFFIRRFKWREMAVGVALIVSFMYVYKFYKQGGSEAFEEYTQGTLDVSQYKYNFDLFDMLLTDFTRADIQPYLVYRYDNSNYKPKMGETYLGFLHFFPGFLVGDKEAMVTKKTAATELMYNYDGKALGFYTTRIFGLLGEYILNFGYSTAFLIFIPLAFFIARLDKWVYSLTQTDIRNFIVPLWILFVVALFNTDSDNAMFFFIKRMAVVMVMVWMVSAKFRKKGARVNQLQNNSTPQ